MSGFNVYPQPVSTNRFVLKQNTAGQVILPGVTSSVGANTSTLDSRFGSWVEVTASTSVEYYITGVVATITVAASAIAPPLFVDIGMGGAGAETSLSTVAIGSSNGQYGGSTPRFAPGGHQLLDAPIRLAASSRLAVRVALFNVQSATQSCNVYLLVVPYSAVEGN